MLFRRLTDFPITCYRVTTTTVSMLFRRLTDFPITCNRVATTTVSMLFRRLTDYPITCYQVATTTVSIRFRRLTHSYYPSEVVTSVSTVTSVSMRFRWFTYSYYPSEVVTSGSCYGVRKPPHWLRNLLVTGPPHWCSASIPRLSSWGSCVGTGCLLTGLATCLEVVILPGVRW